MNINIPESAWAHFWEEPPDGSREFWAFRWKPKCQPGEEITFHYQGTPVARAIVDYVERPGVTRCERTRKYTHRWKVFWKPESFRALIESPVRKSIPCKPGDVIEIVRLFGHEYVITPIEVSEKRVEDGTVSVTFSRKVYEVGKES